MPSSVVLQSTRQQLWRARTLLTFDEGWLYEAEGIAGQTLPRPLRVAGDADNAAECSA